MFFLRENSFFFRKRELLLRENSLLWRGMRFFLGENIFSLRKYAFFLWEAIFSLRVGVFLGKKGFILWEKSGFWIKRRLFWPIFVGKARQFRSFDCVLFPLIRLRRQFELRSLRLRLRAYWVSIELLKHRFIRKVASLFLQNQDFALYLPFWLFLSFIEAFFRPLLGSAKGLISNNRRLLRNLGLFEGNRRRVVLFILSLAGRSHWVWTRKVQLLQERHSNFLL